MKTGSEREKDRGERGERREERGERQTEIKRRSELKIKEEGTERRFPLLRPPLPPSH